VTTMMGSSQNLRRTARKRHICETNSMDLLLRLR
jgi:hypothetical protein